MHNVALKVINTSCSDTCHSLTCPPSFPQRVPSKPTHPLSSLSSLHIYQPSFPSHLPDCHLVLAFVSVHDHSLSLCYSVFPRWLSVAELCSECLPSKWLIAFNCCSSESCSYLLRFLPVAISCKQSLLFPSSLLLFLKNTCFIYFFVLLCTIHYTSCFHFFVVIPASHFFFLQLLISHSRQDSAVWCQDRKGLLLLHSTRQKPTQSTSHRAERVDWACTGLRARVLQISLPNSWGIVYLILSLANTPVKWNLCHTESGHHAHRHFLKEMP